MNWGNVFEIFFSRNSPPEKPIFIHKFVYNIIIVNCKNRDARKKVRAPCEVQNLTYIGTF